MASQCDDFVRRARACVGIRFVPQGRTMAGLDCVGLIGVAYGGALRAPLPADYPLRGGREEAIRTTIERVGFVPCPNGGTAGDLLLASPGFAQWHFAIRTDVGFVHADARLRKIVEMPGAPPWPVTGAWRLETEG